MSGSKGKLEDLGLVLAQRTFKNATEVLERFVLSLFMPFAWTLIPVLDTDEPEGCLDSAWPPQEEGLPSGNLHLPALGPS